MRPRLLLAAAAVVLGGCLSVPVSTLGELRDFGAEQVFTLDPPAPQAALLLGPADGYFTMLRDTTIDLTRKGSR
jgi:hypothetical protein